MHTPQVISRTSSVVRTRTIISAEGQAPQHTRTSTSPTLCLLAPQTECTNLSNRRCVQSCPVAQADNTPSAITCLTNSVVTSCTYVFTVNGDGTSSVTGTPSGVFGYPTTTTIDRVCVPTSAVFNFFDGQSSNNTSTGMSSTFSGGYLSNLFQDVQNVQKNVTVELEVAAGWLRSCDRPQFHRNAVPEVVRWLYGMAEHHRALSLLNWAWIYPCLFRRAVR